MRNNRFTALPYALWLLLFTAVPLFIVVWFSLTDDRGSFTLDNYSYMMLYASVFVRSFRLAVICTGACLILGYPMAYAMSKLSTGGRTVAMADDFGEQGSVKFSARNVASACYTYNKYACGCRLGNGI